MVVLMMERVPVGLRGELSRWMIEPRANVFVGRMSAMVRDRLWDKACRGAKDGAAMMLYSAPTEQGFTVRTRGDTSRALIDVEGLLLVRVPKRSRKVNAPEGGPSGTEIDSLDSSGSSAESRIHEGGVD